MVKETITFTGLSSEQAAEQKRVFGPNTMTARQRNHLWESLLHIVREPMFMLLAVACLLYFFLGDLAESIMMLVSILFVAGIEVYQETRSEKALEALRQFTRAKVRVLRDGDWVELDSEALVPDDMVTIEEGERVPADGIMQECHDCSIDEAILTGESLPVDKSAQAQLFQGTTVSSGKGVFKVTATGMRTEFGKLGKSIDDIDPSSTPLQKQIERFVRNMGIIGGIALAVVFCLNYFWVEHEFWKALLFSLTLAMAILPQEIPVAFSTFMGLGAFRMIRKGILAKQPKTVESLGSATVICLDKTGTITENRMSVAEITDYSGKGITLETALWASEPEPFDAMEKALLQAVSKQKKVTKDPRAGYKIVQEYALAGKPPMMTHIWENAEHGRVVACKGGIERILAVTHLEKTAQKLILEQSNAMAAKGYRILGVASAVYDGKTFHADQDHYTWQFEGLVAFFDPPKENVHKVFQKFYQAGIRVVMITGDHIETAKNIAQKTGLRGWEQALTGKAVVDLSDTELQEKVRHVNVFARMFPDAKLRIVEALKANGETVAMSGDGVNDGPALKSAQIGIAMGKKGSDIAKSAASLVLLQDNLGAMVTALKMGRRIYSNLRKAIRYIISIHLPIVMAVLAPLLFGWRYPHIFLPLHVIFLELVMDPTAAVAFENEPAEKNLMRRPPRAGSTALFTWKEVLFSLLQGAVISTGVLFVYYRALVQDHPEPVVRALVFTTMVFSNLFLTLVNRSFEYTILRTIRYKNKTLPLILLISILLLGAILYLPFLSNLFKVAPLGLAQLGYCLLIAFLSVIWFEVWKGIRKGPTVIKSSEKLK